MTKTDTSDIETQADAIARAIRVLYPHARRRAAVGIIHNGCAQRVLGCIHCGESRSYCSRYPETVEVAGWRAEHDRDCGAVLVKRARAAGGAS